MHAVLPMSSQKGVIMIPDHENNTANSDILTEKIRLVQEQNKLLMQHLEDSKLDRSFLHQQLHAYREREKLGLIREQRDYQRIVRLEGQVKTLIESAESPTKILSSGHKQIPNHETSNIDDSFIWHKSLESEEELEEVNIHFEDEELQNMIDQFLAKKTLKGKSESEFIPSENQIKTNDIESPPIQTKEDLPEDKTVIETKEDLPENEALNIEDHGNESSTEDLETPVETKEDHSIYETKEPEVNPNEKDQLIEQYFANGLEATQKKEYAKAIEYFSKVTEWLPEGAPSYLNLAILYYRLDNYPESRKYAEKAANLGSDPAKSLLERIQKEMDSDSDIIL